jgi:DNA-binding SARP family transcriptional activator
MNPVPKEAPKRRLTTAKGKTGLKGCYGATPEAHVELGILGSFEVRHEGRPVVLGGTKQRALLALLTLHPNEVLSTERLVEELWGDNPPDTATPALQVYVSRLRKALEPNGPPYRFLVTRAPGYAFLLEDGARDVDRFLALVADAHETADPAERAETLREALALWRGEALADLTYEPFVQAEAARLEELRLVALEERIAADLQLGGHTEVVPELESLIAAHPLRDRFRCQLMLALYRSGRQADALATYREGRRLLSDELGLEPGPELQELERQILRHDPALHPAAADVPGRAAAGVFVGHDEEIGLLLAGLEDALAGRGRLFLIGGAAGTGKTRLADEIASRGKQRGARVLWGRCWEAGDAPSYWPWIQALRGRGPNAASALPALVGAPADADRFTLFDATGSFLAGLTCKQPLVVVLDDLQSADEDSRLLLEFVASELAMLPLLLLGLHRDGGESLASVARFATARISL